MSSAEQERNRPSSSAEAIIPTSKKGAKKKLAHPMAPATFLLRNIGKTIPLALVIVLAVMLVAGIIALIDSIPLSIRVIYGNTKQSLGVSPRGNNALLPDVLKKIKSDSPVPLEKIIICRASTGQVESIVGKWPFVVLGLSLPDMHYYMNRLGTQSLTGRLPDDGAAEAVISEPVATNLHLKIGSIVLSPDQENSYSPIPVQVVGIAKTKQWFILDTKSFQDANYLPPVNLAMVFAKAGADQEKLDAWASTRFKGTRAQVFTFQDIQKQTNHMFKTLFTLLDLVIAMLVLIVTLMVGLLINIYQSQRLIEFGLLQAIGYTKSRLIKRALLENVLIVCVGWGLGLVASFFLLVVIWNVLMEPHSFQLDVFDTLAYQYTIPIPLTVLVTACGSVLVRFRKFDPVAVVERRIV